MEKIRLLQTGDGSHTLRNEDLEEVYHSIHGAVTESRHVFLNAGLMHQIQHASPISILEVGMGTGLNVLLTALEASRRKISIRYTGIEPIPPDPSLIGQLNYPSLCSSGAHLFWERIHESTWHQWVRINPHFTLYKYMSGIESVFFEGNPFNLVYFDAFAPEKQPELWTEEIFKRIIQWMSPGGMLVTYCVKGSVKRNLEKCGFKIKKIPGPPGKREMLRALKRG